MLAPADADVQESINAAAAVFINELLGAYNHALHDANSAEWISAASRNVWIARSFARRAYPLDDTQRRVINGLLERVENHPAYAGAMSRYETDAAYRKSADVLDVYRMRMARTGVGAERNAREIESARSMIKAVA